VDFPPGVHRRFSYFTGKGLLGGTPGCGGLAALPPVPPDFLEQVDVVRLGESARHRRIDAEPAQGNLQAFAGETIFSRTAT
jgi:hypothetical protein